MAKAKVLEEAVVEVTENGNGEPNMLYELTRKVVLASIGVVAMTQDEVEKFINKLVERGEIAEQDGRKLVHEVMDKRKKTAKDVEDETSKRVQDVLDRMSIPSKKDIDILSEKISALTVKVDELNKKA